MEIKKTPQDKWEILKNNILTPEQEEIFKNITPQWIKFFKKDKNIKTNSFILWIIGGRGSGKTAEVFKIANTMLKDNPKRVVQFWRASPDLIENIKKTCPEEYKDRFETVFKFKNIKINSIFVIDEGILGANAKEALRIEMKNLVKFLSKSRHYNIVVIVNSISFGILLQFKNAVDMTMYKRLPLSLIRNKQKNDYILKEHSDKILRLKDWESILVSNYKKFNKTGTVSWKYENYCYWFTNGISMYQKNTSPDVDFDEGKRLKEVYDNIVKLTIDTVGDEFKKKAGRRNFKMWLYTNHIDLYQDNIRQLNIIHDLYLYKLSDNHYNSSDSTVLSTKKLKSIDFTLKFKEEDVIESINKEERWIKSERDTKIYKKSKHGAFQEDLALEYNLTQGTISKRIRRIQGTIDSNRGHSFEEEFAKYLISLKIYDKVVWDGDPGKPDIVCYKEDTNEMHIYSCKTTEKRPHTFRKGEFKPEYDEAIKNESKYDKVIVILAVFIYSENKVYLKGLDYRNPRNITIR